MKPSAIFICDGSQNEADELIARCVERGVLVPLKAYKNKFVSLSVYDLITSSLRKRYNQKRAHQKNFGLTGF